MKKREEIYREIEEEFGFVPTPFKSLPDGVLENDFKNFKFLDVKEEGALTLKQRNLIGLGVASAIGCRYCVYYSKVALEGLGATDAEIHEALRYADDTVGWSTYLNGLDMEYEQFKDEVRRMAEHMRKKYETREKIAV